MPFMYNLKYSPIKKVTPTQIKKGIPTYDELMQLSKEDRLATSIRPKDREIVMNLLSYTTDDIVYDIMCYAGLGTSYNIVVDTDTNKAIPYNQKFMVYPSNSINLKNNDQLINFDPIFNFKIMESVFKVYITKIAFERGWDIRSVYLYSKTEDKVKDPTTGKFNIPKYAEVRYTDGTVITSNFYYNETVCYIDLMLRIEGIENLESITKPCDAYILNSKNMKGRQING